MIIRTGGVEIGRPRQVQHLLERDLAAGWVVREASPAGAGLARWFKSVRSPKAARYRRGSVGWRLLGPRCCGLGGDMLEDLVEGH